MSLSVASWLAVLLAAFGAGFTSGFAGFGTGLVASGLWFHALPATMVPPLVALTSVAAQLVGLVTVRRAFAWQRVRPFLVGGVLAVPLGVWVLSQVSPQWLKGSVGAFLVGYVLFQFIGRRGLSPRWQQAPLADAAVGAGGGFLGGFAGLSGPLPLVWLQMKGGGADAQRAVYQPFNLVMLVLASALMGISGRIDGDVLLVTVACLPLTLAGAWLGARVYRGIGEETFRLAVLVLLLASGCVLLVQFAASP